MKMLQDRANGEGLLCLSDEELRSVRRNSFISDVYDVEDTVFARGKFATVRRANHKTTGVQYAAKYIKKRRRAVDMTPEIYHEISVLLKCAPSNRVVRLHEVYETNSDVVLVLELAAGGELQRIFDTDHCLNEIEARRAMRQILEGLCYLHEKNIAHLDLKPQNLLLTVEDCCDDIKLCDFGVSRLLAPGTEVRALLGTPDYVAPEVLSYEPISLATDIWSVGVLAYVLLSGYTPFGADTKQQTYLNISQCILTFEPDHFGDVSGAAVDFIKSSLLVNPRLRPTVQDLLQHPWISPKGHILPPLSIKTADPISTTPKTTPISQRYSTVQESISFKPQKEVPKENDRRYLKTTKELVAENNNDVDSEENNFCGADIRRGSVNDNGETTTASKDDNSDNDSSLSNGTKSEWATSKNPPNILSFDAETQYIKGNISKPSRFAISPQFESVEEFSGPVSELEVTSVEISKEILDDIINNEITDDHLDATIENVDTEENNLEVKIENDISTEKIYNINSEAEHQYQSNENSETDKAETILVQDCCEVTITNTNDTSIEEDPNEVGIRGDEICIEKNSEVVQDIPEKASSEIANVDNNFLLAEHDEICCEVEIDSEVTHGDSEKASPRNSNFGNNSNIWTNEYNPELLIKSTPNKETNTLDDMHNEFCSEKASPEIYYVEHDSEVSTTKNNFDLPSESPSTEEGDIMDTKKVFENSAIEICIEKKYILDHFRVIQDILEEASSEITHIDNNSLLTEHNELCCEIEIDSEVTHSGSEKTSPRNSNFGDNSNIWTNEYNQELLIKWTSNKETNTLDNMQNEICSEKASPDIYNVENDSDVSTIKNNPDLLSESPSNEKGNILDTKQDFEIPAIETVNHKISTEKLAQETEVFCNDEATNSEKQIPKNYCDITIEVIANETKETPSEECIEEAEPIFIHEQHDHVNSEDTSEIVTSTAIVEETYSFDLNTENGMEYKRNATEECNLSDDEQIVAENVDELFENIYKSQEGINEIAGRDINLDLYEENATLNDGFSESRLEVVNTSPSIKNRETSKESLIDLGYGEDYLGTDDEEERFVEDKILWGQHQRSKSFESALKKFQAIEEKEAPKVVKGRRALRRKKSAFSTFADYNCNNSLEHHFTRKTAPVEFENQRSSCYSTTDSTTSDLDMSPENQTKRHSFCDVQNEKTNDGS